MKDMLQDLFYFIFLFFFLVFYQVEKVTWKSVEHNMGMAFDRSMWNEIKRCSKVKQNYLCKLG